MSLSFIHLPGGKLLASKSHLDQAASDALSENVSLIDPRFRLLVLSCDAAVCVGPSHQLPPLAVAGVQEVQGRI